ncbi:MAG: prepilin-type N-terminal cleavage/methylation domain-containing protein [Planctomycetaceae bacterium]|jgi:prepilin-type N-terminal cleavage/methylation domain-containing protein|nr:prepilin-type N-terminal cleavage/methylation domain-containing protein [Planctomycetaceae bacterium]
MKRHGYTLLEILMATAILLLGLTAILGIMRSTHQRSVAAADLADAQLACQTLLNELLAQQSRIKPIPAKPIEGLPDWKITVTVYPATQSGLFTVHVIAQKFDSKTQMPVGIMYQLFRWVPQDRVEIPENNETTLEGIQLLENPF